MKIHYWVFVFFALSTALAFGQDYIVWSGGVSEQEREDAPEGTTKFVFSEEGGAFLSDVEVEVRDRSGQEVVSTTSRGPWLILDLPEGEYILEAARDTGERQGVQFEVGDGESNEEIALAFPADE